MAELTKLTVSQLKAELSKRGAECSGKKGDLICRLGELIKAEEDSESETEENGEENGEDEDEITEEPEGADDEDEDAKDEGAKDEVAKDEVAKDEVVKEEVVKDEVVKDEVVDDEKAKDEEEAEEETPMETESETKTEVIEVEDDDAEEKEEATEVIKVEDDKEEEEEISEKKEDKATKSEPMETQEKNGDKKPEPEATWLDIIAHEKDSKLRDELGKIDKLITAVQKGREIRDLADKNRIQVYPFCPEDVADMEDMFRVCSQVSFRFNSLRNAEGHIESIGHMEMTFMKFTDIEKYKVRLLKLNDKIKIITCTDRNTVDKFGQEFRDYSGIPANADISNKLTLFAPSLPESVTADELWDLFHLAKEIWLVSGSPRQHAYIKFQDQKSLDSNIEELKAKGPPRKEFNFCRLVPFYDVQHVIKTNMGMSGRDRRDFSGNRRLRPGQRQRQVNRQIRREVHSDFDRARKSEPVTKSKSKEKDTKGKASSGSKDKSRDSKDKSRDSKDKSRDSKDTSRDSKDKRRDSKDKTKDIKDKSSDTPAAANKNKTSSQSSTPADKNKDNKSKKPDVKPANRDNRNRKSLDNQQRNRANRLGNQADRGRQQGPNNPQRQRRRTDERPTTRWDNSRNRPQDDIRTSLLGEPPSHVAPLMGPGPSMRPKPAMGGPKPPMSNNPLERALKQLTQPMMRHEPPVPRVAEKQQGLKVLDSLLTTLGQLSHGGPGASNNHLETLAHALQPQDSRYDDRSHERDFDDRDVNVDHSRGRSDRRQDRRGGRNSPTKRIISPSTRSPGRESPMKRRREESRTSNPAQSMSRSYDNREDYMTQAQTGTHSGYRDDYQTSRRDDYAAGYSHRERSPPPSSILGPPPELSASGSSRMFDTSTPVTGTRSSYEPSRQPAPARVTDYASARAETTAEIARMENEYARLMDQLGQSASRQTSSYRQSSYF